MVCFLKKGAGPYIGDLGVIAEEKVLSTDHNHSSVPTDHNRKPNQALRLLDIDDLYILVGFLDPLATTLSVATSLNITQPAVSRRVGKLQHCYPGLFRKEGRRIFLTEKGKTLAGATKVLLNRLQEALGPVNS